MKKLSFLILTLLILSALFNNPQKARSQPSRPDEIQISDYLSEHPLLKKANAHVLDVTIQRESLIINLSENFLSGGVYEDALFNQLQNDLDQTFSINQYYMTTFKVAGEDLEFWGRPLPDFGDRVDLPGIRELPGDGPLNGVKIALSPGHGLYWNETYSDWFYQRVVWYDIREDIVNAEIMRYVKAALQNQGTTVIQLRELDLRARTGITGYPAWHEGSRQYAIAQGLPSWIYNGGSNNYNSDIRTRPYLANYFGADILISLHNNGWNGTLSGTETYWDTDNHPLSYTLAHAVHNSIINTIRAEHDPNWIDRGIKASDSGYGEINYAQMPAILVELAFMDHPLDNAYLHLESFKLLAANAITQGICDYFGASCQETAVTLPLVLEAPTLTPSYSSSLCDSGWYRFPNQRGQYAYLALNVTEENQMSHQASWQPELPVSGEYRLEAFIPAHTAVDWACPEMTVNTDSHHASYEIFHANGLSIVPINQSDFSNAWADLGIFHFNDDTQGSVRLKNVTQEPSQTTTLSVSALRFTLVGNAGVPFHNTPWLEETWITDDANVPTENIRNFMILHHSCLAEAVVDADQQVIDIPTLVYQAGSANGVNPKALLAVMETEQNALSQCPDQAALAKLMGLEPATTAREQIATAAAAMGTTITELKENGETSTGWATGKPKTTLDGVSVIPANDSLTTLFSVSQYAGVLWGGTDLDKNGVQGIYAAWRDYALAAPLPTQIVKRYFPLISR